MINWLIQQSLLLSVIVLFLVALRGPLNRFIATRGNYALWALVPFTLLLSLIPSASTQTIPVFEAFSSSSTGTMLSSIQVSSSNVVSQYWLIWPIGAAMVFLSLCGANISYIKSLNIVKDKPDASSHKGHKGHKQGLNKASSAKLKSPILIGLIRPLLVLPTNFTTQYNADQQALMIEHELTHKQQGDLLWNWVAVCLLSLFWFNPIIWFGYKYFRLQQELSVDEAVLAQQSLKQRQCYAHALVQASAMSSNAYLTHVTYGGKTMLKVRIMKLGQIKSGSRTKTTICATVLTGMVAFMQLAVADTSFDAAAEPAPKVIKRVNPIYPPTAMKQNLSGMVRLSFSVLEDGTTADVNVTKSTSDGIFDHSAVVAVQNWRYKPSNKHSTEVEVQLNFAINGEEAPFEGVETIRVQ
jgi:bla regulator protein BlaR1